MLYLPSSLASYFSASAKRGESKVIPGSPGLYSTRSTSCIVISITKKKEMLICYSQACQNTNNPTKLTKKSKTHVIIMITISLYCNKLSSLLISMISNKEPLRYGTTMELGLIPTEDGARSYLLTSYFRVNKCGQ